MVEDLYPARRCQYWSDFEPAPCQYWDFKYRLCSYWQVTLDDGTIVKATLGGIDNATDTHDDGELPDYSLPLIKRPTKHPHCNMVGTDTWCNYYVSSDGSDAILQEGKNARCILPDQSRHVVRRNSGKKWVQIRRSPKFDSIDKRIMTVAPYMTYTHINAYEVLKEGRTDPDLDGRCLALPDFGTLGYCTWCEGYNPHHYQNTEKGKLLDKEGWGLEFSELDPEDKNYEYHPFPSPHSELDRPKEAQYVDKLHVKLAGDFTVVLIKGSIISLYHEKVLKDSEGNDYTVIEDISTIVIKSYLEEYLDSEIPEETFIVLADPVAEPTLKYIYFGHSSINEFGARLPLRYVIYNKRAELSKCYWWKGNSIDFKATIVENPDLKGMYYTNIKGWHPSDYAICEEDTTTCVSGEPDKEDVAFVGCTCDHALARVFYDPTQIVYHSDYHEVLPICNGAKPECPLYTSSVCWEYCVDEKMQQGDPVLPEQILELRYYARKDKWTKESYNKAFAIPEIYAWSGPTKTVINKTTGKTSISAQRTFITNFRSLNISKESIVLPKGTPTNGIPIYPSLVRAIHEVRSSPIIRNVFDLDNNENSVLEVTDLFHKDVLIFGEIFYQGVSTYAVNMKDPDLKGVFPDALFSINEGGEAPTSMLEIEYSFTGGKKEEYSNFYEELDCALEMLLEFSPNKITPSDCGDDNSMFLINAPSFWGDNNVFVFSKSSGVWEFDKIEFKKVFLSGIIAQTSFVLNGQLETEGLRKTIDYLPMYESSFMTSENDNGSITFDFIPFISDWGGEAEVVYVYNDSVVASQMNRGLPVQEEYVSGLPYTFNNAFEERSKHIWQNSDADGEFRYGLLDQMCTYGGMLMPIDQSALIAKSEGDYRGSLLGVVSGHPIIHHLPAYPDEFNEAYEGSPTNLLYGPKVTEEDEDGKKSLTGERYINVRYQYEAAYKVYKMLVFNGFLYTNQVYHDADEDPVECDSDNDSTCIGNMVFFGNAGYVLVTIPDEDKVLSNYPMPWAIEYLKPTEGDGVYEETGELMYENYKIDIILYVQNPSDPSDEKPFPIWMEVAHKGDELPDNQMILRPKSEHLYGLEPCAAFLRLKIYRFEKRSFGETPETTLDEGFEEIQDELLTPVPHIETVVYRSLGHEVDDEGKPTDKLLDSYVVPGEGANLTGAVRLEEVSFAANKTSYKITGFDVDPLLISVVFKSSLTGRVRGMSRTKMITWVKQPYCRDVWINYAWRREYKVSGWNWYIEGEGKDANQFLSLYDPRCIRDDIDDQEWEAYATPYSPLYPYIDYAPVQYDYQFCRYIHKVGRGHYKTSDVFGTRIKNILYWGWIMSDLTSDNLEKTEFGVRCNPGFDPKTYNETHSFADRRDSDGHSPHFFRRHPYFTPEIWEYDEKISKHGFFDARMMVPSAKQANRARYLWKYPNQRKHSTTYYNYDAIGNEPKFVGLGMYVGGITEFEKDEYYCYIGDKTAYALQGHDVLWCGYLGLTPMAVYSGRKQYGGDIGYFSNFTESAANTYDQMPKWFPSGETRPYPLKFGNVCRDYLSSFRSIDNVYYDKPGRIAAATYPEVKVRRERMIDPNKTGIFNGENPKTSTAYEVYVKELKRIRAINPSSSEEDSEVTNPREKAKKFGFAGVDIPDYYYRKWIPVNYSYTNCDITGSNVEDYPFDLYTSDYTSPFIHPMGLFLANTKIENIDINEAIYMELDSDDNPTSVYARFSFEDVFCVDKLDIDSFDNNNYNNRSRSDEVGLVYPGARHYEDDLERSLYWFVYRPFRIPLRDGDTYDELRGKPEDWGDGVDTSTPEGEEDLELAIHWAWREHWRDLERQPVDLNNLKTCDFQLKNEEEKGVGRDMLRPSFNDPFVEHPDTLAAPLTFSALGRFLFLDLNYPDYQMDGDLFEHRLVCSESDFNESVAIGSNYSVKFIPPPRDVEGRYLHHVFFLQLITAGEDKEGPPRGFTIGTNASQDETTIGRWDPEAMDVAEDEGEIEIPGYTELSAQELYDLYTECCGSESQVISDWIRIDCPHCAGTGKIGINGQECPACYGEARVSPVTLLAEGYTDADASVAESKGRITKRYIDGEHGYEIEEATYHRGLYAELLLGKFSSLPTLTAVLDENLYETCFALKDVEGNAKSILPDTVNGEYVEPGEYYSFNNVFLEAPYNCVKGPGDTAEVIFDFVMASKSVSIDDGIDTPKLRTISKIILEFEVGTKKDKEANAVVLYHEPAIKILAGESGTRTYLTYSDNMTLTKKPLKGKAIGVRNIITRVCEWELTKEDLFDPQQHLRVEMRIKPTKLELEEQGLSGYYNNTNIVNRVKLMSAYLFYSEYVTATEEINTYERKYHISVGGYGDIYPNRFVPNKNEEGELRHSSNGNVGRWHHPEKVNIWKTGLHPTGQTRRSRLSSVYEEDSTEGIIGHNNNNVDTTIELAYMNKCRGRICSEISESGSPLSGQDKPRRFSGSGAVDVPAAELDATEGSVGDVQYWEKLQEINYNKVTGNAGAENIKGAGNNMFTMTSVCPPGLESVLDAMGISKFPVWTCTFVNTVVPPLTPTIQHDPYNHEGNQLAPIRFPPTEESSSRYAFQVRPLFYERNKDMHPYHDWDYELENREMLRLQKDYYYNTIVAAQPWEETTFKYPYPVDAFHTIIRSNENHLPRWGCPDEDKPEFPMWFSVFDTWWLGKDNRQNNAEDFDDLWKGAAYFPDPTQANFYNTVDDYIDYEASILYPTKLVVDKSQGQGSSYINVLKNTSRVSDGPDLFVPYLL